jgi:hypothetical protein
MAVLAVANGSVPGGRVILLYLFTLLLFPTGRLLSPRWRPIAWLAAIAITANSVLATFQRTLPVEYVARTIPNPVGISGCPAPSRGWWGPS